MPDPTSKPASHVDVTAGDVPAATIISVLQEPVVVLSSDLTVEIASRGFYKHFRVDPQNTVGRSIYDVSNGEWNAGGLRRILDSLVRTHAGIQAFRIDHEFQQIGRRVLSVDAERVEQPCGRVSIVLTFRDNTELELAKEYSDKVVGALRDPFVILDWDLRVKSANAPFYATFAVHPSQTENRYIYDLGNGQWNIPRLRQLLEDILPRDATFDDFEVEHEFADIGHRVMLLNARRVNHLRLILLVIEDVTEKKRAHVQQKVLLGELQHRVKNLLMNVRALSRLTGQGASSKEAFTEVFDARLDAMSRTQDLLVRGAEGAARLDQIVRLEMEGIGARQGLTYNLEGPAMGFLARAAHAFAMTIHELATNAAKYGALSQSAVEGWIEIIWSVVPINDREFRFHFRWTEHGLSESPTQKSTGFGTQLVKSSIPYLFGGSSTLNFHKDGVECVIDTVLPKTDLVPVREQRE